MMLLCFPSTFFVPKSYDNLLNDTVEGLKKFVNDVNTKSFPTPKNIVGINDDEYEKFLNKIG